MGQQMSMPGITRFLDAVKLACFSTAIGLVQYVRWQLAIAERAEREADELHRRRRHYFGEQRHAPRDKAGGLLGAVPPDVRRAALNLIDYQLTPVLVDQWRITLVQLLFESAAAAPLPETDPELRAALLDSLKTYEAAERARPAFTDRPQVHVPAPQQQQQHRPSAAAATPSPQHPEPAARHAAAAAALRVAQPAEPEPQRNPAAAAAASTSAGVSSHQGKPHREPGQPSAPPLPAAAAAPSAQLPSPSAPPLPADWAQEQASSSSSSGPPKEEPPDLECHICMDAAVEVQSDTCGHRMCIPCARAVCSLPERAPQCPFCRRAITNLVPIAP